MAYKSKRRVLRVSTFYVARKPIYILTIIASIHELWVDLLNFHEFSVAISIPKIEFLKVIYGKYT